MTGPTGSPGTGSAATDVSAVDWYRYESRSSAHSCVRSLKDGIEPAQVPPVCSVMLVPIAASVSARHGCAIAADGVKAPTSTTAPTLARPARPLLKRI